MTEKDGNELPFIPFFKPEIGEAEINEVIDTLRSGWLTTGPKVRVFEENFKTYLGVEHALAVNSATAGLHLALEALGVGPGDEVITTPFTFTATAEVVHYLGAKVVFVDIDERTLNIDPESIESAVTDRTKALIIVHFAGQACEMGPILEITRKHGVKLVEDAAHALPTTYQGWLAGTFGDLAVFSFYANKTITTGEGGMLVTGSREYARRINIMRLHGIDREVWSRYNSREPSWYYQVVAPGFKYNMSDIMASLGIHQLKKVDEMQRRRAAIAEQYSQAFAGLPIEIPQVLHPEDKHSWHLYIIKLDLDRSSRDRDQLAEDLAGLGIGSSVHYLPLHMHKYWRETYGLSEKDFPRATRCFKRVLSLPLFSRMTDQDVARVIDAVRQLLA